MKSRNRQTAQSQERELKPFANFRPLPDFLVLDEVPLPDGYAPPTWSNQLIAEWQLESELINAGTYPTQSVLIHGPSGVGKTTSARWIASQLELPVFTLMLATAVGSHLGETGGNLATALQYGRDRACVLVIDELDAVARPRQSSGDDVGEMRRVANTLIQLLDQWHAQRRSSLLVATTNLVQEIDGAIRRRFDVEVEAPMPSSAELSKMAGIELPKHFICSQAEMRRLILFARRQAVLRQVVYADVLLGLVT